MPDKPSDDILQGLLDSPIDPGTLLPDRQPGATASTPDSFNKDVELTDLLRPDSDPRRSTAPNLGAGPLDTTLNPEEFKRINQLRPGDDHFERRARAQTWWDLIKGSTVQSLATAVGGTIENFGHLADLFNPDFYRTLSEGQRTFETNWMTHFGRNMQEAARENFPVYMTNRAQEGFHPFGQGSASWWASHVPSIFSSVGLIIPGGLVGKLGGMAARAISLSRLGQGVSRTVSASLASRHMYSSLESAELYERRYKELLQRGYQHDVAIESAANAAGFNYIAGYLNLYKDLIGWSVAFRGVNYASQAIRNRALNVAQHAPRNSRVAQIAQSRTAQIPVWAKGSAGILATGAAESLEEVNIQYQKMVADRWADEILGMAPSERVDGVSYFLSTLGDGSVGEHLRDRHTWDSAFWGFMGGMVFGGLSPRVMNAMNKQERASHEAHIRNVETQLHGVNNAFDQYASLVEDGDTFAAELTLAETLGKLNLSALQSQTLELNTDLYQSILETSDAELTEMGMGEGAKESAQLALDHANRLEKSFNYYMNQELGPNTSAIAMQAAHLETDGYFANLKAQEFRQHFNTRFHESGLYESLSDYGKQRADLTNTEIGLLHVIESIENTLDAAKAGEPASPMDRFRQEALEEALTEYKRQLTQVQDQRSDADNRSQQELSKEAHERETKLTQLTPKSRNVILPLLRSYDAEVSAKVRQAQVARVMDSSNIESINEFMEKERNKQETKAEENAKKQEEEVSRKAQRDESKQNRAQNERTSFIDKNSVKLEELGYPFDTLEQYSTEDLQRAINEGIGPEELSRLKDAEQAPDQAADAHEEFTSEISQDVLDMMARRKGETVNNKEIETPEGPSPESAVTTPDSSQEVQPEGQEDTSPAAEETPSPQPDESVHPEDIPAMSQEVFDDGAWMFELPKVGQDFSPVIVDMRAYLVVPYEGTLHDQKGRRVQEGTPLYGYVMERMSKEYPELHKRVLNKGLANIDGIQVDVKLKDGTRKFIVDENGGVFDARSGVPIDNPQLQNLALVKAENNPARIYKENDLHVAVLSDNRIISLSKNQFANEIYPESDTSPQTQGMREKILTAVQAPTTEQTPGVISARVTEQGTQVEFEIIGPKGNKGLLIRDRNDEQYTFLPVDNQDGTYSSAIKVTPRAQVQQLVERYLPKEVQDMVDTWIAKQQESGYAAEGSEFSKWYNDTFVPFMDKIDQDGTVAKTIDEVQQLQQEESDQSSQVGEETESDTTQDPEVFTEFPENVSLEADNVRAHSKVYYKSTRNKYGEMGGNEAATSFFENPDSPVVGSPIEFVPVLDDFVVKQLPDEIAEAYKKGTPVEIIGPEYYIDTSKGRRRLKDDQLPPIAAYVLNDQGQRILSSNEEVRVFLPQPKTVRGKGRKKSAERVKQDTESIRKILRNRAEMYNAYHAGKTIKSKITSRASGFPIRSARNADGTPRRNSVSEYLQSLNEQNVDYRFGVVNRDKTPVDFSGTFAMEVDGNPGNFLLFIRGFEGKYYPHKLNVRPINRREANFAASLIRGYLKGEIGMNDMITSELSSSVNGMTFKEFFDILAFHGQDATNIYTKQPNDYRRNRTMYFSTVGGNRSFRLGDRNYTAENIDQEVQKIASHIMAHKNHQVSRFGLGSGNRLSGLIGRDAEITWFDRKIDAAAENSYADLLFEGPDPAVTTEAEPSTPPLTQPSIHFDSSFETTASEGETQIVTVEGTEYKVYLDEGRIENLSSGKFINAISPRGKQVLNQVKWDETTEGQQAEQQKENTQKELDNKYGEHLKGLNPKRPTRFSAAPSRKKNLDFDIRSEIEKIEKLLPPGVITNIDPNISLFAKLAGHENPAAVLGMFHRGMIYLSEHAPEGTAYHEAFHAVFNLSLTESTRRQLYAEAAELYEQRNKKKHENDLQLEEFLADEFAIYMLRDGNHSVAPQTNGFFSRLWNWLKNLFTSKSHVDKVFSNIESGFYADAPRYGNEFAETLSTRFKDDSDIFTPDIKDAVVRSLAYQVAEAADFQTSEDVTNIDLQSVPDLIAGYYMDYYESGDVRRANLWGQALLPGNRQKLVEGVEDFFHKLGIQGKNHKVFDYDMNVRQEYDDVDYNRRDHKERLFIPTAYEYSNWDSAGANTKLMVSMLPKINSTQKTKEGLWDYSISEITGDPEFVDGGLVWNLLMDGLSDTVTVSGMPSWNQLLSTIRELSAIEPSLIILAERLESETMPQHKKNEFFNAVGSKVAMNFKTMLAGPDERYRAPESDPTTEAAPFNVAIFDSDLYRAGRRTRNQWQSTFRGKFFTVTDNQVNLNRTKLEHAVNHYKRARNAFQENITDQSIQDFVDTLNAVGLNVDYRTIRSYLDIQATPEGARKQLFRWTDDIFLNQKLNSFSVMVNMKDPLAALRSANPFGLKAMRLLAQHHNYSHPETGENTILAAEAKSKWNYSEANYYFDTLNRLKNDPAFLESMKKERMLNNLTLLPQLRTRGADMRYSVVANVKSRRLHDEGRDYVDSTDYEHFVLKYNSILNGMMPTVNFSDKKTAMMLEGVQFDPFIVLTELNQGEGPTLQHTFSEGILDQFSGYMESEIQRVYQVQEDLRVLSDDHLVENYHYAYNEKGEMDRGLARGAQFLLFPQLRKENLIESHPELHDMLYGERETSRNATADMRPFLREVARDVLQNALNQEYSQLRRKRMLRENGAFSKPLIHYKYLQDTYYTNQSPQMRTELQAYSRHHSSVSTAAIQGLAMTLEQELLMQGDPAFFKDYDDLRKRTSGPAAFRRRLNTNDPRVNKYYRVAVASDIIKSSDYLDTLRKTLRDIEGLNPVRIRKILKPYEEVNTTDAQAFITLDRAVEILRGEGRWRPSDDQILARWRAGETEVLNTRGGRRIKQLFMTPFKGVHYGMERVDPDLNIRVPVYLKYSQFVILPGMLERSPQLRALDTAMRGGLPDNEYIVDEVVFESGVKAGRRAKRNISDFSNIQLVPNFLSNENWGRQVETPTKGITNQGLDGTQVRRNILLGLREGRTYGPDNLSAAEVNYRYNRAISEMVRRGLETLENRLGTQIERGTGLGRITNVENLGQMMRKQAEERNAANNVLEAYDVVDNHLRVEMEINPRGNANEALFLSLFKDNGVRQDVFAGSYVQASSYAFKSYAELTAEQQEGIVLAQDQGELRPPLMEDGKVTAAQVLAPSWFGRLIQDYYTARREEVIEQNKTRKKEDRVPVPEAKTSSQLTRAEIREFFEGEADLLSMIGYRIPNQGLSSIENLEVVGFLPEDLGDSMVVYEELTTKNDSDFDVDKMFALVPEFYIENGKPKRFRFYDTTSKAQLSQIYKERYEGQGQLRGVIEKLDRVKALEKEGMPANEIEQQERNVSFNEDAGEWTIGNWSESKIEGDFRGRLQEVPTRDQFIQENLNQDPFVVNGEQALWNYRLELMKMIMENPNVMAESYMPITDPDLVDTARQLADEIGSIQSFEGVLEFLPSSQIAIGQRFQSGRNMIGILANHFGSHAIATKTNLKIAHVESLAAFAHETYYENKVLKSSLNIYEDSKGRPITEQLSTLMSGFLDATSDSWALELNLTDETANTAALLLRAGAGWEATLMFLNQPVIRELTELKPLLAEGVIQRKGRNAEEHLINFYAGRIRSELNIADIGEALEKRLIEKKDYSDLVAEHNLRNNLRPKNDPQYYYDQMRMVQMFQEIQEVAASVGNFVSTTKFDVDMPASIAELTINDLRIQEAISSGIIEFDGYIDNSFLQAFHQVYNTANVIAAGTYLGKSMLTTEVINDLFGTTAKTALTGGEAYKARRDVNTIRDIQNGVLVYALQSQPRSQNHENPVYRTPEQIKSMFYGSNTMALRLIRMKDMASIADNALIRYLQPSIAPNRPDFIESSYREKGTLFQNRLIHGWEQLLAHENETVQQFASDLAVYAYTTSGMRRSMNTIHDLIPSEILQKVSNYFRDWKASHANKQEAMTMVDQISRDIIRNEYNNELIVPTVYPQHLRRKLMRDKMLVGFQAHENNLPTAKHKDPKTGEESVVAPRVVQHQDQLYKLMSVIPSESTYVYGLIQKKGYHADGYHIYEYFNPDEASIVEENSVPWTVDLADGFREAYTPIAELYPVDPDTGNRRFNMDNLLQKPIC